jgi:hypothetical protein
MISSSAPTEHIYAYVREGRRIRFLQESLQRMVIEKKTTVQELLKLTYFVE